MYQKPKSVKKMNRQQPCPCFLPAIVQKRIPPFSGFATNEIGPDKVKSDSKLYSRAILIVARRENVTLRRQPAVYHVTTGPKQRPSY